MNAAIEAAARAHYGHYADTSWWDNGMTASIKAEMLGRQRAAIIAFLRNCEVSEGMVEAGDDAADVHRDDMTFSPIWDAMKLQLATELEGK